MRGVSHNWFQSYLNGRNQFVQLGPVKSDSQAITCGVPRGSILGPLLFILYINDLVNISQLAYTIMFADDTNLFLAMKILMTL